MKFKWKRYYVASVRGKNVGFHFFLKLCCYAIIALSTLTIPISLYLDSMSVELCIFILALLPITYSAIIYFVFVTLARKIYRKNLSSYTSTQRWLLKSDMHIYKTVSIVYLIIIPLLTNLVIAESVTKYYAQWKSSKNISQNK